MTNEEIIAELVKGNDDVTTVAFLDIFDVHKAMDMARIETMKEVISVIDWIDGDVDNPDWINRKELKMELKK